MIEKSARVLRLEGELAVLEVEQQTACGQCAAKSGCGTSVLAGLFGRKSEFRAWNRIGARTGQSVTVGIPENVLIKASLLMYFLPLITLIVGAATGLWLMQGHILAEPVSIVAGIGGFGIGILLYRLAAFKLQSNPGNLPVLVKQCSPIGATITPVQGPFKQ